MVIDPVSDLILPFFDQSLTNTHLTILRQWQLIQYHSITYICFLNTNCLHPKPQKRFFMRVRIDIIYQSRGWQCQRWYYCQVFLGCEAPLIWVAHLWMWATFFTWGNIFHMRPDSSLSCHSIPNTFGTPQITGLETKPRIQFYISFSFLSFENYKLALLAPPRRCSNCQLVQGSSPSIHPSIQSNI